MRYVVARVITSPVGAVRTARLLITDVPDKTTVQQVLDALTSAGKAAEFSEAGVPFGNHEIKPDHRGWPFGISGIDEATSITWERLTKVPTRNDGRRATLRFTEAEFATVSLAAQRAGKSLQQWALDAMLAAAEGQGAEAAPAPRVTKMTKRDSVPLAPAEVTQ
jgi:hypothetical protein